MIITFEDVSLIILVFFDISNGLEDRNFGTKCSLHLSSISLTTVTVAATVVVPQTVNLIAFYYIFSGGGLTKSIDKSQDSNCQVDGGQPNTRVLPTLSRQKLLWA